MHPARMDGILLAASLHQQSSRPWSTAGELKVDFGLLGSGTCSAEGSMDCQKVSRVGARVHESREEPDQMLGLISEVMALETPHQDARPVTWRSFLPPSSSPSSPFTTSLVSSSRPPSISSQGIPVPPFPFSSRIHTKPQIL